MTAREKAVELIRQMPDFQSLDPYSAQSARLVALRLFEAKVYTGRSHVQAIELVVPGLIRAAKGIPPKHQTHVVRRGYDRP